MTAVIDWDFVSDAELAAAAAAGNQAAFAGIYDRYADRLHDFCVGMVRDREAAADCVQDTFVTAATRLSSLRELDKLRPWLYAIARNEALRRIRERNREQPSDELPEVTSAEPGPDVMASRTELATLIAQVADGLSERDRAVLELTYRHGLDGPELAEALGVSAAGARTMTHRLRETIERALGALLVARVARTGQGCPELGAFLTDWDGEFTILMRKRIARHIDSCPTCQEQRGKMVNPVALLGGAPLFIPAPAGLRQQTLDRIQLVCAQKDLLGPGSTGSPGGSAGPTGSVAGLATVLAAKTPDSADDAVRLDDDPGTEGADDDAGDKRRPRGGLLLFLLLGIAGIAALILTLLWPLNRETSLDPIVVTQTPTQPSPTLSSAPRTPPPAATASTSAAPPPVTSHAPPPPKTYIPPPESAPPSREPSSTRTATPPTRTSSASPSYAPQHSGGPPGTSSGGNGTNGSGGAPRGGSSDAGGSTGSTGGSTGSTGGTTGGSISSSGPPRSSGGSTTP